jgi:uncharacterized protein YoxC
LEKQLRDQGQTITEKENIILKLTSDFNEKDARLQEVKDNCQAIEQKLNEISNDNNSFLRSASIFLQL